MNRKWHFFLTIFIVAVSLATTPVSVHAQAGFEDNRIMLQGFYWESYRHGHDKFPQFGEKNWYQMVTDLATEIR